MRETIVPLISLSALLILVGAAPSTQPTTKPAVPNDWEVRDGAKFTFRAPADLKEDKVRGIDSLVGQWSSPSIKITSDYGWFSDPLDHNYRPKYTRTPVVVGGKKAFLVTYEVPEKLKTPPFAIGVYFPDPTGDGRTRLSVYAQCKDAAAQETAKKILETIQFR
jgi:hypothetical protein